MRRAGIVAGVLGSSIVGVYPAAWGAKHTLTVERYDGNTRTVSCGARTVSAHALDVSKQFVLLTCADEGGVPTRYRMVDLKTGRSLDSRVGSLSPAGTHAVFQLGDRFRPLHFVTARQLSTYVASAGRRSRVELPLATSRACRPAPGIEFDRWVGDSVARFTVGACGTEDVVDHCGTSGTDKVVAAGLDASDRARARRAREPQPPTSCEQ